MTKTRVFCGFWLVQAWSKRLGRCSLQWCGVAAGPFLHVILYIYPIPPLPTRQSRSIQQRKFDSRLPLPAETEKRSAADFDDARPHIQAWEKIIHRPSPSPTHLKAWEAINFVTLSILLFFFPFSFLFFLDRRARPKFLCVTRGTSPTTRSLCGRLRHVETIISILNFPEFLKVRLNASIRDPAPLALGGACYLPSPLPTKHHSLISTLLAASCSPQLASITNLCPSTSSNTV